MLAWIRIQIKSHFMIVCLLTFCDLQASPFISFFLPCNLFIEETRLFSYILDFAKYILIMPGLRVQIFLTVCSWSSSTFSSLSSVLCIYYKLIVWSKYLIRFRLDLKSRTKKKTVLGSSIRRNVMSTCLLLVMLASIDQLWIEK